MSKLIVNLSGGIGNQFFQYSCARSLSIKFNLDLHLDRLSGFINDKQYKRKYELGNYTVNSRYANINDIILYMLINKYCRKSLKENLFTKTLFGNFIIENNLTWLPEINDLDYNKRCWISGYWQSPNYFNEISDVIAHELMPRMPNRKSIIALGDEIMDCDSVSVGVRLYEESKDPSVHALGGKLKTMSEFSQVLSEISIAKPNAKFFVFCTYNSPMLDQISFPKSVNFVFKSLKYIDPYETLWLISRCRHHVFNNSTFYWWGAWLSQFIHNNTKQIIYASDNFINKDGICSNWKTF